MEMKNYPQNAHLIFKIFLGGMPPDPLAGLLFVHTLIDQSMFQMANQISHRSAIMS